MTPPLPSRWAEFSPTQARAVLAILLITAVIGAIFSWNKGNLPKRDAPRARDGSAGASPSQDLPSQQIAPDLQLYRDVTAAVCRGENYYVAAKPELLKQGFPIRSTFNWRLPTYAWLFALLPGPWGIQSLLVLLSAFGLALHFHAEQSLQGLAAAVVSSFLLIGVVKWSVDGLAFYTQELWASVFILISIGASARKETGWRIVFIATGLAALFFRELALPYCGCAALFALYHRRWSEAAAWSIGIACFFAFLYWHSQQVAAQLSPADLQASAPGGIRQWLKFGGLDFVLLTARLNSFLIRAPGPVLFLYLLLTLFGLLSVRNERLTLQVVAAASYLAAFCIVGMEVNFYWGLMYAPLLPAGLAALPASLNLLWQRANSGPELTTAN
jgi:hypothetical protein